MQHIDESLKVNMLSEWSQAKNNSMYCISYSYIKFVKMQSMTESRWERGEKALEREGLQEKNKVLREICSLF